jgi:DNA-binding NtrC family response regulator
VQVAVSSSPVTLPDEGLDLVVFVATVERELIERSLERTGGNKGAAARLLNLKRTTLVEKMKRFDRSAIKPVRDLQ